MTKIGLYLAPIGFQCHFYHQFWLRMQTIYRNFQLELHASRIAYFASVFFKSKSAHSHTECSSALTQQQKAMRIEM